jgi:DNA-nicking Smr family endonuclease
VARRPEPDPPDTVDLHRLTEREAIPVLTRAVHAARVRGLPWLRVVCGRGFGNARQEPVLRRKLEAWLTGPEARRLGVHGFAVSCRGGALDVRLSSGDEGR